MSRDVCHEPPPEFGGSVLQLLRCDQQNAQRLGEEFFVFMPVVAVRIRRSRFVIRCPPVRQFDQLLPQTVLAE